MMKMTGLSHLFKWENLHNWWLTKYFFAPLYIYIYIYIYIRGAKIQYPISVLLQYWHFLLDQGMSDKTDPNPI